MSQHGREWIVHLVGHAGHELADGSEAGDVHEVLSCALEQIRQARALQPGSKQSGHRLQKGLLGVIRCLINSPRQYEHPPDTVFPAHRCAGEVADRRGGPR